MVSNYRYTKSRVCSLLLLDFRISQLIRYYGCWLLLYYICTAYRFEGVGEKTEGEKDSTASSYVEKKNLLTCTLDNLAVTLY